MLFASKNFIFNELFTHKGLQKLDTDFLETLYFNNNELYNKLISFRTQSDPSIVDTSNFIIELSKFLEFYIIDLFEISDEYNKTGIHVQDNITVFFFKNRY